MATHQRFAVAKGLLNQASGMDRIDVHLDRELENLARIADGVVFQEGIDSFFCAARAALRSTVAMRQYSIVQSMVDRVDTEAKTRGATRRADYEA